MDLSMERDEVTLPIKQTLVIKDDASEGVAGNFKLPIYEAKALAVGLGCTDAYNIRVRVYTGVHTCPR